MPVELQRQTCVYRFSPNLIWETTSRIQSEVKQGDSGNVLLVSAAYLALSFIELYDALAGSQTD